MDNLFYVVFVAVLLYAGYQVISKGGFKGAIFGSKVSRTLGEIKIDQIGLINRVVRVHKLENGNIGIELTSKAPLSFSMTGFALSSQQSGQLIQYLRQAN